MISLNIRAVRAHFLWFRLFDDILLSAFRQVHASIDASNREQLRRALNRHKGWPERGVFGDWFYLANFLDVLQWDKDHAQEARNSNQNDNLDHAADTWGIPGHIIIVAEELVDCLDQLRSNDDVEHDDESEVSRSREINPG